MLPGSFLMSPTRRPSFTEDSSLLEDAPPLSYSAGTAEEASTSDERGNGAPSTNSLGRIDLYWVLAGLWSGVLLGAFDGRDISCMKKWSLPRKSTGTVVATLLAPIGSEFQASHQSSYIGTAYLLSVCCFTPLYGKNLSLILCRSFDHCNPGRLADILGRKGAMLLALSLFGSPDNVSPISTIHRSFSRFGYHLLWVCSLHVVTDCGQSNRRNGGWRVRDVERLLLPSNSIFAL